MYMTKIALIATAALLVVGCKAQQAQNNAAEPVETNAEQPLLAGEPEEVHLFWDPASNDWMVSLNSGAKNDPKKVKTKLKNGSGPKMFIVDIVNAPAGTTFKSSGGMSAWEGEFAKDTPQLGINSTQILGPAISDGKLVFVHLNEKRTTPLFIMNCGPSDEGRARRSCRSQ
jgi:hypothetical protein